MRKQGSLALILGALAAWSAGCVEPDAEAGPPAPTPAARAAPPARVVIVLFDQMVPAYADAFDMPNFRRLRDAGTSFERAYLGYMASETVIAHNVITSGLAPNHMGWVDEAWRDTTNLLGKGTDMMHLPRSWGLAEFDTVISAAGYPKLADYLHAARPGTSFIVVGEKSYAVDSAVQPSGDIAVRMSGRQATEPCRTILGGRFRGPSGKNVPAYIDGGGAAACGRFFINSDPANDYGTRAAFPSWIYAGDGNRMVPGTDAAHLGGDVWVADAAIAMMQREAWSGMFITLGGIDKAGHMWGAQRDDGVYDCATGAGQTHVRCAAAIADQQLGRILAQIAAVDAAQGGETLVVLTADHGATWGATFAGKPTLGASTGNWYYGPAGLYDGTTYVPPGDATYSNPSPSLAPLLATGNIQFSYQSSALEAWLIDRSPARLVEAATAGLTLPGASAAYYREAGRYRLHGTTPMAPAEAMWWRQHGQEIVDTLAAANGPDLVVLMHDEVTYGAYGDHGGATESVQRVPMVFWSPSLAAGDARGQPFRTIDVMPTVLRAMGIPLTAPVDGDAVPLGRRDD